jgi:hypothetical protein
MRRSIVLVVALAAVLAVAPARVEAAGLTISDGRIAEVGGPLKVGGGYSLATNRAYSVCLESEAAAPSTYDMSFDLREIEAGTLGKLDEDIRQFVLSHSDERVPVGTTVYRVLGTLTVDGVASLPANGTGLADAAKRLIQRGDLTGFHAACGTHYVRSVTRRARYLSLFSYVTRAHEARDADFEHDLFLAITAFDPDRQRSTHERRRDTALALAGLIRRLRVAVRSLGLGGRKAAIVPFDLDSYWGSLREALHASQLEGVGTPVAIEIVPWAVHPAVLEALDGIGQLKGSAMRDLADAYVEISEATDAAGALVIRARQCRRNLDRTLREPDGSLRPGLDHARVVAPSGRHRLLSELIAALTDEALDELAAAERAYVHTSTLPCVARIEESAGKRPPDEIPECEQQRPFAHPAAVLIRNYCPVRLYVPMQ